METKTEVSFTTSQKMTLYVYYGVSGTKTNVKVDGVKQAGAPTTVVLEAGAHNGREGTTVTLDTDNGPVAFEVNAASSVQLCDDEDLFD